MEIEKMQLPEINQEQAEELIQNLKKVVSESKLTANEHAYFSLRLTQMERKLSEIFKTKTDE